MTRKLTLAFIPLSSCGGCEVQVLRAFILYPELQELYEIVYWPMVVEATKLPRNIDVALVEGLVRTRENLEMLRKARFSASKIIVVGSCAAWGGIGGSADAISVRRSMQAIYGREKLDGQRAPEILPRVFAPADLVPVDYIISRCPPPVSHIVLTLKAVAEGKPVPVAYTTVCSQCPRKIKTIKELEFKKGLPGPETDPETCFLSQGYLCLGSVTVVGCGAPCPQHGIPCFGCGGPYYEIAQRRDMDVVTMLARRVATLAGLDPVADLDKVVKKLLKVYSPRRFYVFTLASEVLRRKPQGFAVKAIASTRSSEEIRQLLERRRRFVESGEID